MTTCRKIAVLALAAILCLTMAACGHAVPSGRLEMDSATGAGTASFTMVVPKNGARDVGNNFVEPNGNDGPNHTAYITNPDALLKLVQDNVPEGFTVTMEEQTRMVDHEDEFGDIDTVDEGSFDYSITFSFNGIEDYNARMKQWLPQKYWDAAKNALAAEAGEAVLTTDGGAALTADMRILDVICQWAFDLISTDTTGAVVDGGSGFDFQYCYNMDKASFAVVLDGEESSARYGTSNNLVTVGSAAADATTPSVTNQPETDLPATNPPATAPADEEPAEGPSGGVVAAIVAVVFAAAICIVIVLRKRGKK